jgi:hypothetical protein
VVGSGLECKHQKLIGGRTCFLRKTSRPPLRCGVWLPPTGCPKHLHAAASLGIADRLASGPKNAKQLARDTESEPSSLYRLLRALASVGVFEEGVDGQFSLTALGERLRSDVSESMLPWVLLLNGPLFRRAWENLVHSVRTGKPGFDEVYGQPAWVCLPFIPTASSTLTFSRAAR